MRPMLASPGDRVPSGERWRHEVKWDGVRTLVTLTPAGDVTLVSRNGNDITPAWPELRHPPTASRAEGGEGVLDGEIIALNHRGIPDFRTLAERIHVRKQPAVARLAARIPATLMVFDLLRWAGEDLVDRSWSERRTLLESLDLTGSGWQVPPTYDDGAMLHEATRMQGLEGIVSKRVDARYRPGERSKHWLKFAHRHSGSYVVGGWRPQEGTADRLAALLVGEPTPEGLRYRGRVGSGIGARQSRLLTDLLVGHQRASSPFVDEVPRADARGTHWLDPVLVVDVDSHGLGHDRLRQPSYRGVREDLTPEDLLDPDATDALGGGRDG